MESESVFSCPWFTIHDKSSYFELRNHHEQVVVLPIVQASDLVFVRVHRQLFSEALWELPAGAVESGETPLDAGMRELMEETGIRAFDTDFWLELDPIAVMPNRMSERAHVFLVHLNEAQWTERSAHDDEIAEVGRFDEQELMQMLSSGSLSVALPMAVALRYLALR